MVYMGATGSYPGQAAFSPYGYTLWYQSHIIVSNKFQHYCLVDA